MIHTVVYRFTVFAFWAALAVFGALTFDGWGLAFVSFFVLAALWQLAALHWLDR